MQGIINAGPLVSNGPMLRSLVPPPLPVVVFPAAAPAAVDGDGVAAPLHI